MVAHRPKAFPVVVMLVLGVVLVAGFSVQAGQGSGRSSRVVPENARPLPGDDGENYPDVGGRQKVVIGRESLAASASALIRDPVRSSWQLAGRLAERVAVRSRGALPTSIEAGFRLQPGNPAGPLDLGGHGGPSTPAHLEFLTQSDVAIDSLLEMIGSARQRVDLMMYPWQDDPTGQRVAEALIERARQGVRVRVMVDRTGLLLHNPPEARGEITLFDRMRTTPNLLFLETPGVFFRFDHRKLAVVDGRVAWSGSVILTEVGRQWRNFQFRAEGPIVAQLLQVFERHWQELGGVPEPACLPGPNPEAPPNACVRLVETNLGGTRSFQKTIYHAVDHARHRITLENPYFTDSILVAKLIQARARGVDVRVILTLRGNEKLVDRYEVVVANRLFQGGVRVYLYPAMTHVKAMTVDGVWSYLGTGNFDELSLRNNREVGLSIAGVEATSVLEQELFLPDLAASQEIHALMPPPPGRYFLELISGWF